jgi:hypothetical protein
MDRPAHCNHLALFPLLCVLACNEQEPLREPSLYSTDAKLETYDMLREDLAARRHASDGGGKAWLIEPESSKGRRPSVPVGSRQRFAIVYEAGPLGIAEGGMIFLQTSPFWGWDSPQVDVQEAPGYTEVRADASDIELHPKSLGPQLLGIEIGGRALEGGERITIVFGAGPAMARVDRYAERRSHLWIAVDGNGDGVRSVLADSPSVDVVATRASRLIVTLPSTARPGEPFRMTAALLDELGNAGVEFEGRVTFENLQEDSKLPAGINFETSHRGARTIDAVVHEEGVYRLRARAVALGEDPELAPVALSNPMVVRRDIPHLRWGDLHGHSQLSDGTGTPEDYFLYARDVAALDVAALTDHDHWGMRFLDQNPDMWTEVRDTARRLNEPQRFVALSGYEWTSWLHGHRHVLFFSDQSEILSSLDPRYETPEQLWAALEGLEAISVAHHSAGGPVSTNWNFIPNARIEPVTEIISVHGSSEASDSPGRIYDGVEGNFVRDALGHEAFFGFVGSGDSHDGHPGLAHLGSPSGGMVAIFTEELSRSAVLEALRSRRVYATNGPRIWLRVWLDEHPMGSVLSPSPEPTQQLRIAAAPTAPLESVELIRSGEIVKVLPGLDTLEWSESIEIPSLAPGEYLYLRLIQQDGGMAWSSPIYVKQMGGT